ncbi:MAG: hypothetical protein II889_11520 [Clostridia bacterium]|nr:hypothetical protein [Clostridia bacterium]
MTGLYRLGDRNILIHSIFQHIHQYCTQYQSDGVPDFTVTITPADIAFERERATRNCEDDYLETLAVYRKIAEKMPDYDTVLMHGSAVAVDGEAFLFAAPSGTGKSTHTRLWREVFGERAVMVNDDKPLVRIAENGATVYGTPWNGKHHLDSNIAVPLRAICLLERDQTNHIHEITPQEALPALVRQTYRPLDPAAMVKTLTLLDRLKSNTRFYRLGCNMEREAAQVAYRGMKGQP